MSSQYPRGHLGISGKFLLVLISMLLSFIVSEIAYRLYMYSKYVNGRYRVSVITGRTTPNTFPHPHNMFLQNETYRWLQFDEAGTLVQETRFHHNNVGWRSDFNYSREKASGEFRIAVIGDSFVASHLSNVSWTDELAMHLSNDPELKSSAFATISVYSFAVDGAGFEDYRQLYCMGAKPYSPDLIVLNFIPEALPRRNPALQDKTCDQIERATLETPSSTDISGRTNAWVESVHGVKVHLTCTKPPSKLDNPACSLANLFLATREIATDSKRMTEVKRFVAKAQLRPNLLLSNRIYLLDLLDNKLFSKVPYADSARNYSTENDIQRAFAVIDYIATDSRKPIFVFRAPTHRDLTENRTGHYGESFSRVATARYFDLRREVVGKFPDKNRAFSKQNNHYFNLPHDGHFSDLGSQAYARATYNTIRAYLLAHQQQQ